MSFHQGIRVHRKARPPIFTVVIALAAFAWSTAQAELTWLNGPPIGAGQVNSRFAQGMSPSGGVVVGGPQAPGTGTGSKAWYWTAGSGVVVLGTGYAVEATDTVSLNPQVFVPGFHVVVNTPGPEMGLLYTIATLTGLPPTTTNLSTLFPGGGTANGHVVDGRAFSNGDIVYAGTRETTILPDGTVVRAYRQYIDANGPDQYDIISPFPGDTITVATDMSADYNVVVGTSGTGNYFGAGDADQLLDRKPFIWSKNTGTSLFIPVFGYAAAVSADGSTVVGQHTVIGGTATEAFRHRSGLVEPLGCVTFGVTAPCGPYGQFTSNVTASEAFDASADGSVVVGRSTYGPPPGYFGASFGFWWFDGVMHDLQDLLEFQGDDLQGIDIIRVTAVSDDGLVVAGWGSDPGNGANPILSFVARLDPIALGLQGIPFDSDGDGLRDAVDNCIDVGNSTQCDSDADGYGNHCDGDMNNNTATNSQDYVLFRQELGTVTGAPYNKADINCNGTVNSQDYVLFRGLLGKPPGPGVAP